MVDGARPNEQGPWGDVLNPLPKYVATRTLTGKLDWNATALEGDAVDSVAKLKADLDGDLVMSGCGEMARTLLKAGLVDEVNFWVHPAISDSASSPAPRAADRCCLALRPTSAGRAAMSGSGCRRATGRAGTGSIRARRRACGRCRGWRVSR